jgi:hypothetical protein
MGRVNEVGARPSTVKRHAKLHGFEPTRSVPNPPSAPIEIARDFLIAIFGAALISLEFVRPVTPEVAGSSPVSLAIIALFRQSRSSRLRRGR